MLRGKPFGLSTSHRAGVMPAPVDLPFRGVRLSDVVRSRTTPNPNAESRAPTPTLSPDPDPFNRLIQCPLTPTSPSEREIVVFCFPVTRSTHRSSQPRKIERGKVLVVRRTVFSSILRLLSGSVRTLPPSPSWPCRRRSKYLVFSPSRSKSTKSTAATAKCRLVSLADPAS